MNVGTCKYVPGENCGNLAPMEQCDLIFRGAITQLGIYENTQSILFYGWCPLTHC